MVTLLWWLFSLLLASFCCNTKTLEAEKFLSSSQFFFEKSNFPCNWPVLGCTWSYQVQSNWHKYQVQSNLPSTKYFLPSYMYLVLGGQVQSTKYLAKSTWCLVNYKSNCKVIGNSSKVTVLDTALFTTKLKKLVIRRKTMHFCLALVYTPPNDALLRFQVGRSDSGHFLPDEVFQRAVVLEWSGALNDGQTGVRHGECGGVGDRA